MWGSFSSGKVQKTEHGNDAIIYFAQCCAQHSISYKFLTTGFHLGRNRKVKKWLGESQQR